MKNTILSLMILSSFSGFAQEASQGAQSLKLMYKCKILGKSTLAKEVSIFGDFSSGEKEKQPGLVILTDGNRSKAFNSLISLQGNEFPWQKSTSVVDASNLGYRETDLAISIDLTQKRKVGLVQRANGLIGLAKSGTFDAQKLESLNCEFLF